MSIFRLLKIALYFVMAPSENCYETHQKLILFLYVLLLLMLLWLAVHVWRMDASAAAAAIATTPICTQSKKKTSMYKNTLIKPKPLHTSFYMMILYTRRLLTLTRSVARLPLCLFYTSFAASNTNPHLVCIFHSILLCVRFFVCFSYENALFST